MLEKVRNQFFQRKARKLFLGKIEKFWYCGAMNEYQYELSKQGKPWKASEIEFPTEEFVINPFNDAGGKVPKVGDIIPCIKKGGWVGFYEVTKKYRSYDPAFADRLPWDDGYDIDLVLHHLERE